MGSAVSGLMGGGGGGLLGAIGGIVGGIFGGPLGSMIGQALGNMVQDAVGDATNQAVDTLQKEHGMPKFLADMVKSKVNELIQGLQEGGVDQGTQEQVNDSTRGGREEFVQSMADDIVKSVMDNMAKMRKEGLENSDEDRAQAKQSGKKGSGSWLEALAKAMGEQLGKKAAKMVELGDKIASTAGGEGKEAAKANAEATTEMQATSQMFNLMQSAFSNAIKSIGEGLTQMSRKQ